MWQFEKHVRHGLRVMAELDKSPVEDLVSVTSFETGLDSTENISGVAKNFLKDPYR